MISIGEEPVVDEALPSGNPPEDVSVTGNDKLAVPKPLGRMHAQPVRPAY